MKIVVLALAGLLFVLVSAVAVLLLIVQTEWGGDRVLRVVLPRVNDELAGRIEAQHLRLSWREITIEGVRLRDPEGGTVAQVMRVHLRWAPLKLVRRHIEIREITLQQPRLDFEQAENGESNLQRALASRTKSTEPRAAEQPSRPTDWRMDLHRLAIVDGRVDLRFAGEGMASRWQAGQVNGEIAGRFDGRADGRFALRVWARAQTSKPVDQSLRVNVGARGAWVPDRLSVEGNGEVRWGDNVFRLSGRAKQNGSTSAWFHIDELRVQPELLRVFSPDAPLVTSVVCQGDVEWEGKPWQLTADLAASVGGAQLDVKSVVRTAPLAVRSLALRVRSLDLAKVVRGGPPSRLELLLDANAEGQDLASLKGRATVRMPAGVLGGYAVGPVHLRAEADHGRYRLLELSAVLPGMRVSGAGQTGRRNLRFAGLIDVPDLGKTVAAVMAGSPGPKARASGRGRIEISAAGPLQGPALRVRGRMADLVWGDVDVPRLRLDVDVPNLSKPLVSDLHLSASRIIYGSRRLDDVNVAYRASGPRFHAKVSARPLDTTLLEASGTWDRARSAVTLSDGSFKVGRARWELFGPTVFSADKDAWRVSGLDLRGPGEQRLRLEATRKGPGLQADLWISQLRLALLPAGLLPAPLKPAGQVDAEVHVRGRLQDPIVDARLVLEHAEIDGLADISLTSNAHLLARRFTGDLRIEGGGGHLSGRFDLPATWPPPAKSSLLLDLTALDLDLQLLADKLARGKVRLPRLTGLACLKVLLQGTGAHPNLALDLRFRELHIGSSPMGNLNVQVAASDGKPMTARLDIHAIGRQTGSAQVSLRTGLSLNDLMRPNLALPRWEAVPLRLDAHMKHIVLAPVMALTGSTRRWGGEADMDATWEGTLFDGSGKLRVLGRGIAMDRYPPTDVVVDVESGKRQQQARVRLSRRDADLVVLDVDLQASLSDLRTQANLSQLPVRMHAVLGPLQVRREGLSPMTYRDPSRVLHGRLQASADLTGTLGAPHLQARAGFTDIRLDEIVVGSADLALSYRDGRAQGNLDVHTSDGGHGHADALILADLGYPGITHGLGQAPLGGHLRATNFDLSGFSGLTPRLRKVAGTVLANLEVSGRVDDPRPSGRFEWKDGELAIAGVGVYRNIHLLVQGDREILTLNELKLESGAGDARITGRGQHREQGGYDITTKIRLNRLPLYIEGQSLGTLSLDAEAQSQVTARQTQAQVEIGSARVVLSDAKRKQLQKLARPENVVLMDDGRPLNDEQKRKLAKLDSELGLVASQESTPASPEPRAPVAVVTVTAPRDIWITGEDANLELSVQPGFRVEMGEQTQIFGRVEIRRGLVNLLGQRFDLKESSSVVFGGSPDQPELDVIAIYNDWQDNILVEVTVKGTPEELQIGIRAPERPDLTESQLYTLVLTGRLTLGESTGSADSRGNQAASLLGGLVAGQVQRMLAKRLPLDVLTIETGSDLGTARVEAGTYVTRRLYVGYVSRLGAMDPALLQNRNAVRLEYDLTSRWSFQGEYGDAMNGSADVIWTKHY